MGMGKGTGIGHGNGGFGTGRDMGLTMGGRSTYLGYSNDFSDTKEQAATATAIRNIKQTAPRKARARDLSLG
jgi:hypothetical protein